MQGKLITQWQHSHSFGQDRPKAGERRTLLVITITGLTMVVEVLAGLAFGSMALLADGLHMASHTIALGIAAWAYVYARHHAHDHRFSFGTGKVNSLAGFSGAILLAVFALLMAYESVDRFSHPVSIVFNQAILVAIIGLLVNALSFGILGGYRDHKEHSLHHDQLQDCHHKDHNLRSAYLHVLADALTSLLAIFALLGGKYLGWIWMDPLMGIIGAILVSQWSFGLLRGSGRVLLDREAPAHLRTAIREGVESQDGTRITDLHTWAIGPDIYAAIVGIATSEPKSAEHYKTLLPQNAGLVHVTVEVHHCPQGPEEATS